jgi:hypothetical protein
VADYKLIMLTNAKAGRDEEFKKWYDERHLGDMLRIPGVKGAQTFDSNMVMSPDPASTYKYLAVYDITTEDLSHTLGSLQKAAGTDAMPMSDAMDPKTWAVVYRARSTRRS